MSAPLLITAWAHTISLAHAKFVLLCVDDVYFDLADLELSKDDLCGWDSHRLAASVLVGRWSSCLKVFATAFMETVGRQSGSVLSEEQVFEQREKEFRRDMDHLRTSSHKDILLEVSCSGTPFL